ncbi:PREDICTED: uncharacterized protein LOC106807157 isoform X2 [Priapulus caudatus]|uniref:Uncharacterized protein LOC106807157 isoform X2 n=1 Tax=Priapulus caudatus TaxID=37621 RepID=A0ABM1DY91_PRICU|nr:PREDICTED: uncharacterized protein LOC106807157 isoform X2 [Priapulus caudatus]
MVQNIYLIWPLPTVAMTVLLLTAVVDTRTLPDNTAGEDEDLSMAYNDTNDNNTMGSDVNVTTTLDYETQRLLQMRERKKQEHLLWIQAVILQRLGMSRKPNISSSAFTDEERTSLMDAFETIYRTGNEGNENVGEFYAKRFKTNPPSCLAPPGVNCASGATPTLTSCACTFDLSNPRDTPRPEEIDSKVSSATLRLYLLPQDESSRRETRSTIGQRPRKSRKARKTRKNRNRNRAEVRDPIADASADEADESGQEKIRISIMQYMMPLNIPKLKRSKMVPVGESGWVNFNIKSTVRAWVRRPDDNQGLEIHIENSRGEPVPAARFIAPLNCSIHKGSQASHVLRRVHVQSSNVEASNSLGTETNTEVPPVDPSLLKEHCPWLDIGTMDVPRTTRPSRDPSIGRDLSEAAGTPDVVPRNEADGDEPPDYHPVDDYEPKPIDFSQFISTPFPLVSYPEHTLPSAEDGLGGEPDR